MRDNESSGAGYFLMAVAVGFILSRLFGLVEWPWLYVLIPTFLLMIPVVVLLLVAGFVWFFDKESKHG